MSLKLKLVNDISCSVVFDKDPLSAIIGQESAKEQLCFYGEKYLSSGIFPSILLKGSHGLGKTYFTTILSKCMCSKLIIINCGILNSLEEFIEEVLLSQVLGKERVTLLFDEAHALNKDISTFLLSLLAPNEQGINHVLYRDVLIEYNFEYINSVFATTDTYKMLGPLINRCRTINLELYRGDELYRILQMYTKGLSMSMDVKEEVIDACRGRARDAYLLSDDLLHASSGDGKLSIDEWNNYCKVFNINHLGLNNLEINYLQILREVKRMSSSNISKKLGLNKRNIEEEIEVRLMELNLIESSSRGRLLTEKGLSYCENHL